MIILISLCLNNTFIFMHSLRRRLKAQHEVIGTQSARLAQIQANMEQPAPMQDNVTSQSLCFLKHAMHCKVMLCTYVCVEV